MGEKIIEASQAKAGTAIIVEGVPCIVKTNDISKTGKHGHAKCRIEAISVIDGKKKVFAVSGHERFEVPLINKRKGQVLSISGEKANIMDLESFENLDLTIPEDLKNEIKDGDQIEYWEVLDSKIIKRKL